MTAAIPDRFDRLEAMVNSLANTSSNLLEATKRIAEAQQGQEVRIQQLENGYESRIQRLEDGQLALQELGGLIAGETRQLKRAVDYLMSKDGERES